MGAARRGVSARRLRGCAGAGAVRAVAAVREGLRPRRRVHPARPAAGGPGPGQRSRDRGLRDRVGRGAQGRSPRPHRRHRPAEDRPPRGEAGGGAQRSAVHRAEHHDVPLPDVHPGAGPGPGGRRLPRQGGRRPGEAAVRPAEEDRRPGRGRLRARARDPDGEAGAEVRRADQAARGLGRPQEGRREPGELPGRRGWGSRGPRGRPGAARQGAGGRQREGRGRAVEGPRRVEKGRR